MASVEMSSSLEDYMEAIYHLAGRDNVARSKDISGRLGVTTASVTGAMRALAKRKLVNYAPYQMVTLTEKGRKVAERVVGRHQALKMFFVTVLGFDAKEAGENACRIEHVISESLLERFIRFAEFIRVCPRTDRRCVERFGYYFEHPERVYSGAHCAHCLAAIHIRPRKGRKRSEDRNARAGETETA
jgi:DtxR family Mn-dependent transcriptional regulator